MLLCIHYSTLPDHDIKRHDETLLSHTLLLLQKGGLSWLILAIEPLHAELVLVGLSTSPGLHGSAVLRVRDGRDWGSHVGVVVGESERGPRRDA